MLKSIAAEREYQAWERLCRLLYLVGAVSKADLKAPMSRSDTTGTRLLTALREWGECRVAVAAEDAALQGDIDAAEGQGPAPGIGA